MVLFVDLGCGQAIVELGQGELDDVETEEMGDGLSHEATVWRVLLGRVVKGHQHDGKGAA